MRHVVAIASVVCVLIAGCVTVPPGNEFSRGKTQDLVVRTDPSGATCSVWREGGLVTLIETTPGVATVPRKDAPIEIVCRKDGYLEHRETIAVENAAAVARDESHLKPPPSGEVTAATAEMGALQGIASVGSQALAHSVALSVGGSAAAAGAMAIGGLVLAPLVMIAIVVNNPPYAFPRLPDFDLTPATFDSEAARNAYFVRRTAELETFGRTERTRVANSCQRTYCQLQLETVLAEGKSHQPEDCFSRFCQKKLIQADAAQELRVERLGVERAQTRLGTQ